MRETTYQGYRIRFHCTNVWFAHIYRPGLNVMMKEVITASRQEGEQVLLKRVHDQIDEVIADLAAHNGSDQHE